MNLLKVLTSNDHKIYIVSNNFSFMSDSVITVKNLTKKYGDFTAISDVSFNVKKDEIFSLVGPNGAGKTTTVEIIECLKESTSGSVEVLGYDVSEDENKIKQRIGVMPQEFNTFDKLSVEENVELIKDIYGGGLEIEKVMESMGILDFREKEFRELSGGMKRKTGIAMALVSDPEILFLDEPTTGLDPNARRETWEQIKNLKELGKTVFLTSHYMEEIQELSDRAAVLLDGQIKALDTIDNLITKYGGKMKIVAGTHNQEVKSLLQEHSDDVFKEENELIGLFPNKEDARETILELHKLKLDFEMKLVEPTMEDVFLELAGQKISEAGELK